LCFRVFQGFLGPELNRGPFTGSLDRMYYCTRITWVKLVRDYFCLDIIWKVILKKEVKIDHTQIVTVDLDSPRRELSVRGLGL
jgi:hypothetical protein